MSFAGHVYDMIRRDKENRALKKQRRDKNKEIREKYINQGTSYPEPDITLEEFEQINRQLREKEEEEQQLIYRRKLIILGIGFILTLIIGSILFFLKE